jgi:hypothetical protein
VNAFSEPPASLLDAETYNQVRGILVQGPVNRPRAIIEGYRTFLMHWNIAKRRKLKIDAKMLAGLALLKTSWPDEFDYVVRYPEYFFYRHALSHGRGNSVCRSTQTDELFDLGIPLLAKDSPLRHYGDVNLGRLLAEIELPDPFDINSLWSYLTLFSEEYDRAPIGILHEHAREALRSGDPVRIRFIERVDSIKTQQAYKSSIVGELWDFLDRVQGGVQPNASEVEINEGLIYAAGLIGDEEAVDVLQRLLSVSSKLSHRLPSRIIYALGHLASKDVPVNEAVTTLVELADIRNRAQGVHSQAMGRLAASLLRYCFLRREQILHIVPAWYKHVNFDTDAIMDVLRIIDPGQYAVDVLLDLCERVKERAWPVHLGRVLLSLVLEHSEAPISERAFKLLHSYPGQVQVIQWLAELSLKSSEWRHRCWREIGQIQSSMEEWRAKEWIDIFDFLRHHNWLDEDVMVFIGALSNSAKIHIQSVQILCDIHSQNISLRGRDEIMGHLLRISTDETTADEIRTYAEKYLDAIEQSRVSGL